VNARIEAGAAEFSAYTPEPKNERDRLMNAGCRYTAKRIIKASDEELFSEEAIEQAAQLLAEKAGPFPGNTPYDIVRAVIVALKGGDA